MCMPRSEALSKDLREFIKTRYMFFGENSRNIANNINNDKVLLQKYGKLDHSSVEYHINAIKKDLDVYLSEDAIDSYQSEFFKKQKEFEQEISDLNTMIEQEANKEHKLRLMRFAHDVRVDLIKHITDSRLPLAVAKFKKEREKYKPKKLEKKEEKKDKEPQIYFVPTEGETT